MLLGWAGWLVLVAAGEGGCGAAITIAGAQVSQEPRSEMSTHPVARVCWGFRCWCDCVSCVWGAAHSGIGWSRWHRQMQVLLVRPPVNKSHLLPHPPPQPTNNQSESYEAHRLHTLRRQQTKPRAGHYDVVWQLRCVLRCVNWGWLYLADD